jgi:hypothetical protein
MHCSNLAADALHAAIKEYQCKHKGDQGSCEGGPTPPRSGCCPT